MSRQPFAKKSLGQNFLVDDNFIDKVIHAVDPREEDIVVEIGPGRGAITERLVETGANVLAIELDREFVPMLRERFAENSNFTVTEADAIEADIAALISGLSSSTTRTPHTVKLVANLPYYISTAILQRLAEQKEIFSSLVLMFQKEVVDRITAQRGNSDRGFLTVIVETAFTVEKLFDVPGNAFRPVPKVTSSVVRLTPKESRIEDPKAFRDLVSKAFLQKRKNIHNNLKNHFPNADDALTKANIDPTRRAESMSLDEWERLFFAIY